MSDFARRTDVKISFDGVDITSDIKKFMLSLTYTDNEEDTPDDLQIALHDRDGIWMEKWLNEAIDAAAASRLKISADIEPKFWGDDTVLPTGAHELDRVDASGPPSRLTIRATSLPFAASIRQTKKDKAWESYTLSGIASEIAGNGGMGCMYLATSDPTFDRVEQVKTSDMDFLLELCHNAGISLKASDGNIVLFDQADYESKPPVLTLTKGKKGYETYKLSTGAANTQYATCHVRYQDPNTGKLVEGNATAEGADTESGQCLEISAKVANEGEANDLAAKQLRLHNKFERMAVFKLPGNTKLVAGVVVELKSFGGWDGKYIVKQARHTVTDSGGYTTQITLRRILEGY